MEVDPPNTALSPTTVVRPSHIPKLINNAIEDKEKITVADGQEYLKRQREDDWIENRVARIEAQNGKLEKLRSDVKVEEAKLENLEREYKSEDHKAPSTTVVSEEENTTAEEEPTLEGGAYTTTAEEEPTLEVLSTDPQVPYEKPGTLKNTTAGEEIKAETFAPLIVSNSSTEGDVTNAEIFDPTRIGFDGEVIKAETFEPMEIDHRGSTRADRIRDIHIHIHLNK